MTTLESPAPLAGGNDLGHLSQTAPTPGSCLKGDTVLMRADTGWPITVGGLVGRHDGLVLTMREAGVLAPQRPAAFLTHGPTQLYQITTQTGRQIETGADRSFLTRDGWTPLAELEPGDGVAVIAEYPGLFGRGETDTDLLKLLAYLTAMGTNGDGSTSAMVDADLRQDFASAVEAKGDQYVEMFDEDSTPRFRVCGRYGARSRALSYLELVGVHGVCGPDKVVPELVFGLRKEQLRLYLNRLFTLDGEPETTGRIRYRAASTQMARQIQHLLARFGVVASVRDREPARDGEPTGDGRDGRDGPDRHAGVGAELVIGTKPDLVRFIDEIGFLGHKARAAEWIRASLYHVRVVDAPFDRLGGVLFDRVMAVEPTESAPGYDLGIDGSHNFVANDFVVRASR